MGVGHIAAGGAGDGGGGGRFGFTIVFGFGWLRLLRLSIWLINTGKSSGEGGVRSISDQNLGPKWLNEMG
jgi:hypothetical protein